MTNVDTPDSGLGSGLKTRHLTMMGLGSAIGAGLFLGTGVGIRVAGPSILLAYLLAGAVIVFVGSTGSRIRLSAIRCLAHSAPSLRCNGRSRNLWRFGGNGVFV